MTSDNIAYLHSKMLAAILRNDYDKLVHLSTFYYYQDKRNETFFDTAMAKNQNGMTVDHKIIHFLFEKGYFYTTSNLRILQTAINRNDLPLLQYYFEKGLHHPHKQDSLFDFDKDLLEHATLPVRPEFIKFLIHHGGNVNNIDETNLCNIIYNQHSDILIDMFNNGYDYESHKSTILFLFRHASQNNKLNISTFLMEKFPILDEVEKILNPVTFQNKEVITFLMQYKQSLILKNNLELTLDKNTDTVIKKKKI